MGRGLNKRFTNSQQAHKIMPNTISYEQEMLIKTIMDTTSHPLGL